MYCVERVSKQRKLLVVLLPPGGKMISTDFTKGMLFRLLSILVAAVILFMFFVVFRRQYRESQAYDACHERCYPYVVQQCTVGWSDPIPKSVYCFNADGRVEKK